MRLEKEIGVDYHKAAFTDRQKEQLVSWEYILAHRDALEPDVHGMSAPSKGKALKKMYNHMLLSFYTHLPPGRNEYRMLRIVDEAPKGRGSKEENFYVKGQHGDELILHRYKTAKHYGSANSKVPVPDDLQKAVHKSLDLHPREYVFANFAKPGTPWTTLYMSNRMGAVLPDKKLGSGLLRKIAITEFASAGRAAGRRSPRPCATNWRPASSSIRTGARARRMTCSICEPSHRPRFVMLGVPRTDFLSPRREIA